MQACPYKTTFSSEVTWHHIGQPNYYIDTYIHTHRYLYIHLEPQFDLYVWRSTPPKHSRVPSPGQSIDSKRGHFEACSNSRTKEESPTNAAQPKGVKPATVNGRVVFTKQNIGKWHTSHWKKMKDHLQHCLYSGDWNSCQSFCPSKIMVKHSRAFCWGWQGVLYTP